MHFFPIVSIQDLTCRLYAKSTGKNDFLNQLWTDATDITVANKQAVISESQY